MPDQQDDYRDSLLFRHCKTEEAYRAALENVERNRRRDQQRWRRSALAPTQPVNEGPPPPRPSAPPAEPPDRLRSFIAFFEAACRDYPDKMREILAPLSLDIIEEYLKQED